MSEQQKQVELDVVVEKDTVVNQDTGVAAVEKTSENPKVSEDAIDEAAYCYRKTKKSAWGMFLVACAAFFGRYPVFVRKITS